MTSLFSHKKKVPVDVNELRDKGLQAAKDGDLNNAIKSWTSAISAQSDNAEIHFLLAASFQVLHNIDSSAKHYRKVIELQPKNIEAHLDLAILLSTYAIQKMSRTGQKFTAEQALQEYGYYEEVINALATCQNFSCDLQTISDHLWDYQSLLGSPFMSSKMEVSIEGKPVYVSPVDWLNNMKFPPECFIEGRNISDVLADFKGSDCVAYVLAHSPFPDNFSRLLKKRKQKHTLIGPTMNDNMIKSAISQIHPGHVLLANIQRVALSSDYSWIENTSWARLVLILVNPNSMLLSELLGAFLRTSPQSVQATQRDFLFVSP